MTEKLEANCAQDEVIVMQAARYGRMQLGRCVKVDCVPGHYEIQVWLFSLLLFVFFREFSLLLSMFQ